MIFSDEEKSSDVATGTIVVVVAIGDSSPLFVGFSCSTIGLVFDFESVLSFFGDDDDLDE